MIIIKLSKKENLSAGANMFKKSVLNVDEYKGDSAL